MQRYWSFETLLIKLVNFLFRFSLVDILFILYSLILSRYSRVRLVISLARYSYGDQRGFCVLWFFFSTASFEHADR